MTIPENMVGSRTRICRYISWKDSPEHSLRAEIKRAMVVGKNRINAINSLTIKILIDTLMEWVVPEEKPHDYTEKFGTLCTMKVGRQVY